MVVPSQKIQGIRPKYKLGLTKKIQTSDLNDNDRTLMSTQELFDQSESNDFQSLLKLNEHINEIVHANVFFLFIELLQKISLDYKDNGLTFNELKNRYLSFFKKDMNNSNLFCDLLSANLETMDLNQLKQEFNHNKNSNQNDKNVKTTDSIQTTKIKHEQSDYNSIENGDTNGNITENVERNGSGNGSGNDDGNDDGSENGNGNDVENYGDYETDNSDQTISNSDSFKENHSQIDSSKCSARTANGKQCSRKKQKGIDFCGSHLHNQPHGRIDQATTPGKNLPKRRGRPPKNMNKQNHIEQQIETIEIDTVTESINGIVYLVSDDGNIYEMPEKFNSGEGGEIDKEQFKLLGKKSPDGKIVWYSENDLIFLNQS
jgi:hypothetical protein